MYKGVYRKNELIVGIKLVKPRLYRDYSLTNYLRNYFI